MFAAIVPKTRKQKILIVDDHPIIRQGLARLIDSEADIEVCGGAESVVEALEQVKTLRPDLVVVNISLKDSSGIEVISRLRELDPEVKTLVWSVYDEKAYAERALRAGAQGYVNKQEPIHEMVGAIRRVLQGEIHLSARMTNQLLQRLGGDGFEQDPVAGLSDREMEVFRMIGRGMTTQQIAGKLGIKPKTVETHREKVKAKLNLRNSAELNQRAVQWMLENA